MSLESPRIEAPLAPHHNRQPSEPSIDIADCGAAADGRTLNTAAIQTAFDRCGEAGGGVVQFGPGTWRTGQLHLRSHTTLRLAEGAVLLGSDDCRDYGATSSAALLSATDAVGVRIEGPGVVDGANCTNPAGEGGVRGPHGLWLMHCRDVVVRDVTFRHIGNWGVAAWRSCDLTFDRFSVQGGYDGIDVGDCHRVHLAACDLRTGDDCIAGAGNRDMLIEDSFFNTACNALRVSCERLRAVRCRLEGPGQYEHRGTGRYNMLAAFVHFSPNDRAYRGPTPHSDHWLIEDCTVKDVDCLYEYDGGHFWQDGRPVGTVVFRRLMASGFVMPVSVYGRCSGEDGLRRHCRLVFEDAVLEPRHGVEDCGYFDLRRHGGLILKRVTLRRNGSSQPIRAIDGGRVEVEDLTLEPFAAQPAETAVEALRGANRWVIEDGPSRSDSANSEMACFADLLAGCTPAGNYINGLLRGRWYMRPGVEDLLIVWSMGGEVEAAVRGAVTATDANGKAPPGAPSKPWHPRGGPNGVTLSIRVGGTPLLLRGSGIELV